jgi:hypothetical protein
MVLIKLGLYIFSAISIGFPLRYDYFGKWASNLNGEEKEAGGCPLCQAHSDVQKNGNTLGVKKLHEDTGANRGAGLRNRQKTAIF